VNKFCISQIASSVCNHLRMAGGVHAARCKGTTVSMEISHGKK